VDWVVTGLVVVAYFVQGYNLKWGFGLAVVANAAWVVYGAVTGQWGFVPGSILLALLSARNLRRWSDGLTPTTASRTEPPTLPPGLRVFTVGDHTCIPGPTGDVECDGGCAVPTGTGDNDPQEGPR